MAGNLTRLQLLAKYGYAELDGERARRVLTPAPAALFPDAFGLFKSCFIFAEGEPEHAPTGARVSTGNAVLVVPDDRRPGELAALVLVESFADYRAAMTAKWGAFYYLKKEVNMQHFLMGLYLIFSHIHKETHRFVHNQLIEYKDKAYECFTRADLAPVHSLLRPPAPLPAATPASSADDDGIHSGPSSPREPLLALGRPAAPAAGSPPTRGDEDLLATPATPGMPSPDLPAQEPAATPAPSKRQKRADEDEDDSPILVGPRKRSRTEDYDAMTETELQTQAAASMLKLTKHMRAARAHALRKQEWQADIGKWIIAQLDIECVHGIWDMDYFSIDVHIPGHCHQMQDFTTMVAASLQEDARLRPHQKRFFTTDSLEIAFFYPPANQRSIDGDDFTLKYLESDIGHNIFAPNVLRLRAMIRMVGGGAPKELLPSPAKRHVFPALLPPLEERERRRALDRERDAERERERTRETGAHHTPPRARLPVPPTRASPATPVTPATPPPSGSRVPLPKKDERAAAAPASTKSRRSAVKMPQRLTTHRLLFGDEDKEGDAPLGKADSPDKLEQGDAREEEEEAVRPGAARAPAPRGSEEEEEEEEAHSSDYESRKHASRKWRTGTRQPDKLRKETPKEARSDELRKHAPHAWQGGQVDNGRCQYFNIRANWRCTRPAEDITAHNVRVCRQHICQRPGCRNICRNDGKTMCDRHSRRPQ